MSSTREEKLVEIFKDYYNDEVNDKVSSFANDPTTDIFTIDLEKFERYDPDCFEKTLIKNPDKCIENAEIALQQVLGMSDFELRLENPPDRYKTPIPNVRTDKVNELVFIEGTIAKSTDVKAKMDVAKFECQDCGHIVERFIEGEDISGYPSIGDCPNSDNQGHSSGKTNMDLLLKETRMVDYQRLRVQESPDDMDGDNPKNVDVTVAGEDLAGTADAGQKVTITGVLRVTQKDPKSAILEKHIEGVNIELEEVSTEDIEITEEDEEKIKELAQQDNIYEKLAMSIEPTIYGYIEERKGAVFQIFSGVKKEFRNSGDIRGDIHVLYVGDPGTGKSRILKYAAELSPTGGVFTSGKSASEAGITAAAVPDKEFGEDKWILKAGAIVMADQGIACVDELDKMDSKDRSALHEGLEQQQVSVSKAGINATLNSRCSLLAAANPKHGRFEDHEMVSEQITLGPTLMSRFDLIFTIKDKPDEDLDGNIADQIIQNNVQGQKNVQQKQDLLDEDEDKTTQDADEEMAEVDAPVPRDLFQKYVAYAQENYHPRLTPDAQKLIRDKYVNIRQDGAERDVISLTARALDSLIRLTEAAARIKLSNEATEEHARLAIQLYEEHLNQVGVDPETGELDADVLESGTSATQRETIKVLLETIEELEDEGDEHGAMKKDIMEEMTEKGFDESEVEDKISKLSRDGEILSPGGNGEEKRYATV